MQRSLCKHTRTCSTLKRALSTYNFNALFDTNHLDLPRLPIPNLQDTLHRYEASLRPLYANNSEATQSNQAIQHFLQHGGEELQQQLCAQDQAKHVSGEFPHFYFEDLWDDAYLHARCPNPVNISPTFFMPTLPSSTPNAQEVITGEFLSASARWLVHARAGNLAADGLDMSRLGRVMGTARLPGIEADSLEHYGDTSTHVVVQTNSGEFYRVDILTADGKQALSSQAIAEALSHIKAASKGRSSAATPGVGVLTSLPRAEWAKARLELVQSDLTGTNEETLHVIDSALLVVALDQLDSGDDVAQYCRTNLHVSMYKLVQIDGKTFCLWDFAAVRSVPGH